MSYRPILLFATFLAVSINGLADTPVYRLFEHEIVNDNYYDNKFLDVSLNVQYQAPSL